MPSSQFIHWSDHCKPNAKTLKPHRYPTIPGVVITLSYMLSKRLQEIAQSIREASHKVGNDPQGRRGVAYVAHAIADDHCTTQERYHFLLMCKVPFDLP